MASSKMALGLYLPAQPPLTDIGRLVYVARMLRLDSVTVWDHFQDLFPQALWDSDFTWLAGRSPTPHEWFDYRTLLGYLAPRAGRLRLGVTVTEPIRHHPVSIAQSAMTLAHMTKRPPILGLGAGERENTEPYGLSLTQPVGRLEEALQVIRQCFTSRGPFDFQGKHFQLNDAVLDLQPPAGRTPEIWIAAHGPRMLKLTAKYGDGWYPHILFPDEYAEKLEIIRQAARGAGRDPDAVTPSNVVVVFVAPTEQEARAMLGTRIGRFMTLVMPASAWHRLELDHPLGTDFRGIIDIVPESYSRETLEEAIKHVPVDMVAETAAWGTPRQIIRKLQAFSEAGARHLGLTVGSALISQRAALYSLRALWGINRALQAGKNT